MEQTVRKFLEFNGKTIYFLAKNGVYWIALKPICEALSISFEKQRERLSKDKFWDQLPTIQGVVAADGKVRKMLCLPEQFIYGWLCGLQSKNADLIAYKRKCYQLLFDYFHGSITSRETLIKAKTKDQVEAERLEIALLTNTDYQQLQLTRGRIRAANSQLRDLDKAIIKDQLELFNN